MRPRQKPENSKGNAADWGDWDPKDNPAVSHGFTSRADYEEAVRLGRLDARKQAVADQIVPLLASNLSQDGGNTPNLSAIPPPTTFGFGKKVNDRIHIGGWPSMKGFRDWKLSFWKAVAAASSRPDAAFVWICAIVAAKSIEELCNSEDFPELDALLATEWDKILTGEFKKTIRVLEYKLLQEKKTIKGRQITWLVFDHFRLSDVDGAMLNWDEILRIELKMPGDNVRQFLNDWDTTFTNINNTPDEDFLESMFKRQLEKSHSLKPILALYHQSITHGKEPKCYTRLRYIMKKSPWRKSS